MKKLPVLVLLLSSMVLLSSCDLFRKMAGRPTSKDIEAKRIMIEQEQKQHQHRLDSLKIQQKHLSDSLAVLDSIRQSRSSLVATRQLSDQTKRELTHRYYVIVGAFGKTENAQKFAESARQAGYTPSLISYKNGFMAVGVSPADKLTQAYDALKEIRESGFCPDAWILDNN